MPRHLKTDLLDQVLLASDVGSVIVFTRTKHGADRLTRQLKQRGHTVAALHGDRTQGQRERALADLKRGRVQVLVATDIASRGIDVEDISHVINYDVPHTPEDYVHRIGRTGRVDAVGDAFTLMSPEERSDVVAIERFLGRSIPRVQVPDFDYKRAAERGAPPPSRERARGSAPGRGGSGRGPKREGGRNGVAEGGARERGTRRSPAPAAPSSGETGSTGRDASVKWDWPQPAHGRRPKRNAPDRRRRRM